MADELTDAQAPARHLGRLRARMAEEGLTAFLARGTSNIQWLTAFDRVFDEEAAHALFVDQGRAVLHTDSRYSEACRRAAEGTGIAVNDVREGHGAFAAKLWSHRFMAEAADKLGIEDSIELCEYRALEKAFGEGEAPLPLRETDGVVAGLRAVKDPYEIARMRRAQTITDAAFAHIAEFMAPGMTERQVQLELENFMVTRGADGLAFPSIVATGANGASPHAIPGETVLEAGQCVVLDFGARIAGYCSDMTRTVFLGMPEGEMAAAWEALRAANEAVEAMLAPGVTGAEAHQLAEDVLEGHGFGGKMGHGLGHGVGLDIHEQPVLSPRNPQPLAAGNVVTVEPGIYLPGRFGMRLEDFGVVTETGFDVFTASTHEMVVI
ncbi:M24 family metallopeptidase [Parvibacter caecicola]|uniref:M24 family metallopeptidase n=1 Tax=Parvibacter caecicola TaxID=747645 RepID=UPI00249CAA5F|nr:Xaa-Pro peptidase family protein [Parvibacter caecicola]